MESKPHSYSHGRVSRLASSCPRDFDFEFFVYQNETNYDVWWSRKRFIKWFVNVPDETAWNVVLCVAVLLGLIGSISRSSDTSTSIFYADIGYNIGYATHMAAMIYEYIKMDHIKATWSKKIGLVLDIISYTHYIAVFFNKEVYHHIKFVCYTLRLHRPFRYLLALTESNLKANVAGTLLKFVYFSVVFRLLFSYLWITFVKIYFDPENRPPNVAVKPQIDTLVATPQGQFGAAYYLISKIFMPIGVELTPRSDSLRIFYLVIVLTGSLIVSGAAVASLSLVISLYLRPEEAYRARFRLIMKDMIDTKMPSSLRNKVETFYRMYWHKQKGVSVTQLLPTFPPTIASSIFTDIYFESQQKSPILRDLSYQFLWEVAKLMKTENYIPGDAIISRNSQKSAIIYIAYGDVVLLTAEDDNTPLLRLARGTILGACAGCMPIACSTAMVEIRAATFCVAHVLKATDLWRVALKYGKTNGQSFILLSAFEEHFEKIKRHYRMRTPYPVKYKSSILQFKRNLMALKEARDDNGKLLLVRTDYFLQIAGCYIMRNRDDSALTEESDAICLRSTFPCILQPESTLLAIWHAFISCVIVMVIFTHPYQLIYLHKSKSDSLDFKFYDGVVTVLFFLDLIVHLSTGANVEEGVPITFCQTSTQQIQNPWFLVDLLGTLPIFELIGDGSFAGLNKLLRIPKVFRTLKSAEEVCVYHSNVVRLMSYALLLFIVIYISSAIQFSYLCFSVNRCIVNNFTHTPYWSSGTMTGDNIRNTVSYSVYSALALVTFTSHRMFPLRQTTVAYMFLSFAMVEFCMILHIFIEAMYSATIMVTTAIEDHYATTIHNLKNFLIRNRMDPMLRFRFIQYLELCWYTDKAYSITHNKRSILYDLPNHVYKDILARQRNEYILCLPFMRFVHPEHLKLIAAQANLFYTSPNEILLNTGDITTEIYIIKRGFCEVYDPNTHEVVELISGKQYFGVLECLLRFPAYYTVRATTHVQILSISRKFLGSVIENPQIIDVIEYCKKQPEYRKVSGRREAFMEFERPPPAPNRFRFPLLRKFEPDTAFMLPFTKIGFMSILRYVFPRFTIRPDGKYIMRYEWFRAICAFTTAMVCPRYFFTVYEMQWLYELVLILDITAYFDMIQRLLIGYYDKKGILVSHPISTATHYIKGAFIVDLMACLPLEHLEDDHYENPLYKNDIRFLSKEMEQFLMMNRLLQLYRLPGAMGVLKEYISRRDVVLVINAIPIFMVLLNLISSVIFIESADIYRPDLNYPGPANRKFILIVENGSWPYIFEHLYSFNMLNSTWYMFVTIYFWVTSEVVGTGFDIQKPNNLEQMHVIIIGIFTGAMLITYFSVLVISIRANVNVVLANYQQNISNISLYMRRERLDLDLQKEILDYYHHNWNKMGGLDYRNVLKLCDQITLRTDAIVHIYGPTFAKCPVLYHCDLSLLRVMGRAVHSLYFQENTRIIESDDVIADMYFIEYGSIDVCLEKGATSAMKLTRGSVFGNLDAKRTVRCPTAMVATTNVHLLQINSVMFHTIILDFPTVRVLMKKYRPHNENYIVGAKGGEGGSSMSLVTSTRSSSRVSISAFVSNRKSVYTIFDPENKILQGYLVVICLAVVYADIGNAGFQSSNLPYIIILYCLDFAFLVKILIFFILPLLIREGEGRDHLMDSRKSYIRKELKFDVLSIIPIEALCFLSKKHRKGWFSVLRLNRVLRTLTIHKCLKQHQERLSMNIVFYTAVSVTIWFSLFAHVMTCSWHRLGVYNERHWPNSSWMTITRSYGKEPCHNAYICSFYFIVSTFTMSGAEILPKNVNELLFVIMLQILSAFIFMLYVGEFSNIFQYTSYTAFTYYTKCLELEEFLSNNRVSKNLKSIVERYTLYLWHRNKGVQVPYFLENAPPCFKLNIMSAAYMRHLQKVLELDNKASGVRYTVLSAESAVNHLRCSISTVNIIFAECETAFLRQLSGCLELFAYCEDIFVVKESEITDSMYILHEGLVQEIDEDMDESNQKQTFVAGDIFGTLQGLVWNTPYTYSYRAKINSQVLTLSLRTWDYLLEHFPRSRYLIYKNIPGHPYGKEPEPDSEDHPPEVIEKPHSQWGADRRRRSTVYEKMAMADLSDIEITTFSTQSDEGVVEHATEIVTENTEQETELEDEKQRMLQRRPTFFQKVAQKLTTAPSERRKTQDFLASEGKDSLHYEEEEAATAALLDDEMQIDDNIEMPELPPMTSSTAKSPIKKEKEEEEEDESVARRAPRLSFIPGLVQKKMAEDKVPAVKPKLIQDESEEEEEYDEELASKKAPRLSFLPGLVQKDKIDDDDDEDEGNETQKTPKQPKPVSKPTLSLPTKITEIKPAKPTVDPKTGDMSKQKSLGHLARDEDDDITKPFYNPSLDSRDVKEDDFFNIKQIGGKSLNMDKTDEVAENNKSKSVDKTKEKSLEDSNKEENLKTDKNVVKPLQELAMDEANKTLKLYEEELDKAFSEVQDDVAEVSDEIRENDKKKAESIKMPVKNYEKNVESSVAPIKDNIEAVESKKDVESSITPVKYEAKAAEPAKDVEKIAARLKAPVKDADETTAAKPLLGSVKNYGAEGLKAPGKDLDKAPEPLKIAGKISEEPKAPIKADEKLKEGPTQSKESDAGPSMKNVEEEFDLNEFDDIEEYLLKVEDTDAIDDYIKTDKKGIAGLKRLMSKDKNKDQIASSKSAMRISKRIVRVRYGSQDEGENVEGEEEEELLDEDKPPDKDKPSAR